MNKTFGVIYPTNSYYIENRSDLWLQLEKGYTDQLSKLSIANNGSKQRHSLQTIVFWG